MFAVKLFSKALKQKRKASNVTAVNCKKNQINDSKTSPQKKTKTSQKKPKEFVS